MKKRTKTYQPKPVKNTLHLFNGRAPADPKDATTLKLVYRLIFERVRTGAADEADLFAMASLLENLHIAVEYSSDLDNKEATFAQLRQAASHIMHAVRNHRSALSGEGLTMLSEALAWHDAMLDHTSEYMVKQIVKVCQYRAEKGEFRVVQTGN